MGEQGAALQKYNQELVKCIEQIKLKRCEIAIEVEQEEIIRHDLEKQIRELQTKLDAVNASISHKVELKNNYDRAVKESESAYMKILESSEILLDKVRRDSEILGDQDH
ncbi:Sjogren syndrome nuclear autoantigen 1 [Nesidiocoris tenuis]|uniref:Sjogren syndrome nuclear autoantigen 1 n=1 Tax=Nesidiocoris tenuis TaxID=355587 RepID=A0ABN7A7X6_9HEMI|nr:Sjogren syndrome nuclear autoantigen 1 [Nesidiocoris tenuis]